MVIATVYIAVQDTINIIEDIFQEFVIMGTEFKDAVADMNTEDSGNSCGSSVVSDQTDIYDGDGVQVSDLEESLDQRDDALNLEQVGGVHIFYCAIWFCATCFEWKGNRILQPRSIDMLVHF